MLYTKRHRLRLRGRLPLALPPPLPRRRLRRCGVSGGEHGLAQREGLLELVEVAPVLRGLLRALLLDLLQLRKEVLVALDELPVRLLRCGEIRRRVRAARTLCVCAGAGGGGCVWRLAWSICTSAAVCCVVRASSSLCWRSRATSSCSG